MFHTNALAAFKCHHNSAMVEERAGAGAGAGAGDEELSAVARLACSLLPLPYMGIYNMLSCQLVSFNDLSARS